MEMLFLVAALTLFGVLLGAVVHLPLPAVVAIATVITCWLAVYLVRRRQAGRSR
ncbi:hypothetical protein [Streptomyces sp. RPT161]|uniref:hypothetical protein n=1 Tax=Streptomyces sp. RPT161 TaxID=3015993 RepID=UPI0022B91792|nr:hypothetical protein [Streptomyces sp. RPT161]